MATAFNQPSARMTDLERLNESERRVLRLLAEGHTAKSIALVIGSSPAAVNERLREARRKTGIGSSRELARLLKSQENRDEQIGVADTRRIAATDVPQAPASARRGTGKRTGAMVILLGALAAAAATLQLSDGPKADPVVDPLLGTIPSSEQAPDTMYKKIRSERRDPAWAPKAEETLRARYSAIEHIGTPNAVLRIMCASTLCEVAGTIDAPELKGGEYDDPNHPLNKAVRELQDAPLYEDLKKAGLERAAGMFTSTATEPRRSAFIAYYSRVK